MKWLKPPDQSSRRWSTGSAVISHSKPLIVAGLPTLIVNRIGLGVPGKAEQAAIAPGVFCRALNQVAVAPG